MDILRTDIVAKAKEVVEREAQAVSVLADQFDDSLVDVVDLLLHCQGHILVAGAGTSHAMAARFAHLLSCCGTPALCINAADSLHGGAGAITADDVVFIISKGGHSVEINRFAEIAHERGAKIIAQTENPERRGPVLNQLPGHLFGYLCLRRSYGCRLSAFPSPLRRGCHGGRHQRIV